MASEAGSFAAGIWAEPYLWASLAAIFLGLAIGQGCAALFFGLPERNPNRGGLARATAFLVQSRRRGRRAARAICFLSLGILSLAAFLVLAQGAEFVKAGLFVGKASALTIWALALLVLAALAGLRPLAAGLPLALIFIALCVLFRLGLEGWAPLRLTSGQALRIATFLPYELGGASTRGHLELLVRDSGPLVQDLTLDSSSLALSVESLALSGPAGFLAELVEALSPGRGGLGGRFFRVVGISGPGGKSLGFPSRSPLPVFETLLPLPEGAGLEPSGRADAPGALLGFAQRSRASSEARSLVALEPLAFSLDEAGLPSAIAP